VDEALITFLNVLQTPLTSNNTSESPHGYFNLKISHTINELKLNTVCVFNGTETKLRKATKTRHKNKTKNIEVM